MAIEKRWAAILPSVFTSDGAIDGKLSIADTYPFKVKQIVNINAIGLPQLTLEVKRVYSSTLLAVGPIGGAIDARTNISLYTVSLSANISADEQLRSNIPEEKIQRITLEEEPVNATRTFSVDEYGNPYNSDNPLPVNATITVPPVEVAIDAFSKIPPDNLEVVGTEDGTLNGTKHVIKIDSNGNLNTIQMGQLVPKIFDTVSAAYPSSSQEVYTYKTGGLGGTVVATVTVNYTSSSKDLILNVVRT